MSTALVKAKTGPKPLPRNKCVVYECQRTADHPTVGLCHMHYARNRRHGSTEISRRESGSGTITTYGYVAHSSNQKKTMEHVLIVEKAIGKRLPFGAEVHHVNGVRSDNSAGNLVVCPSRAYHKLLHAREAALEACGNASFRKCPFCKQYDDTKNMNHNQSSRYYFHAACKSKYNLDRREK